VVVAQAAATAGGHDDFLAVFRDFTLDLTGFRVADHGAQRDIEVFVLAVCPVHQLAAAAFTGFCDDVLAVLQVEQGPHVVRSADDDVAAAPPVPAVGAALCGHLRTVKVGGTWAAFARPATDFDVVYEVLAGHPISARGPRRWLPSGGR
jgi:hypothetical protein